MILASEPREVRKLENISGDQQNKCLSGLSLLANLVGTQDNIVHLMNYQSPLHSESNFGTKLLTILGQCCIKLVY